MKHLGYRLPREQPVVERSMIAWVFAAASKPNVDQRVIFCAPRGNYVTGTYRGGYWELDGDELHPEPHRANYQPSIWRPA